MANRRRIMLVVGTRPNFMKIAPVARELEDRADSFEAILVHTNQHFDDDMSAVFLDELGLGQPEFALGVGAGTRGQQIARVVERLEPILLETEPDLVLVPGDVNSTLGAALAATAAGMAVGHVEAGLRSYDRSMPEEMNRVLVDALSALHFTHSPEARDNLLREGVDPSSIHYVGNTMIDTLVALRRHFEGLDVQREYGLDRRAYLVVTLHRPALVDGPLLRAAFRFLREVASDYVVVFPVHPRTQAALVKEGITTGDRRVRLLPPLGYLEFVGLVTGAAGVITDSGGIQEETTFLGIPCFTLRDVTERPVTVDVGTNIVLGLDPSRIAEVPRLLDERRSAAHRVPELWDGRAAGRLVDVLETDLEWDAPLPGERVRAALNEPGAQLTED